VVRGLQSGHGMKASMKERESHEEGDESRRVNVDGGCG
jgi:hypothetical protein